MSKKKEQPEEAVEQNPVAEVPAEVPAPDPKPPLPQPDP